MKCGIKGDGSNRPLCVVETHEKGEGWAGGYGASSLKELGSGISQLNLDQLHIRLAQK